AWEVGRGSGRLLARGQSVVVLRSATLPSTTMTGGSSDVMLSPSAGLLRAIPLEGTGGAVLAGPASSSSMRCPPAGSEGASDLAKICDSATDTETGSGCVSEGFPSPAGEAGN